MSDRKLRAAERAWSEAGSVGNQARLLIERVRSGELEQSRLELAAYCGHAAAKLALVGSFETESFGGWASAVPTSRSTLAPAIVALGEEIERAWEVLAAQDARAALLVVPILRSLAVGEASDSDVQIARGRLDAELSELPISSASEEQVETGVALLGALDVLLDALDCSMIPDVEDENLAFMANRLRAAVAALSSGGDMNTTLQGEIASAVKRNLRSSLL